MTVPDGERAWAGVLRMQARFVPVFDRELQSSTGLSLAWYDVLLELHSADGRLRMSELGERVVLSRTRVSRIVDELTVAGLASREPNADDGRSSYAVLTDEGRRRFREGARVYRRAIEREIAGRIEPSALKALANTLESALLT